MEIGDKVVFEFGKAKGGKKKETKEGVVIKAFPKNVYIRADFPNHPGKLIRRKRHEVKSA